MRDSLLFLLILGYRLINSLTITTFFQPDEFYQSLEPAHHLIFKYGFLTWEFKTALRSLTYPLFFAGPYSILNLLRIDTPALIALVGPVVGAVQAAVQDYFTAKFTLKYFPHAGRLALIVPLFSSWNWAVSTRTFSNSMEASLCSIALYYWPFISVDKLDSDSLFYEYVMTSVKSLAALGFAFLVRPTVGLMWIVPALRQIAKHNTTFLFEAVFVGYVVVQYSAIIDSFYYGSLSFPLLNFLRFNSSGAANFYGISNWHYYLTQGLPMILTGYLPFAVHGMTKSHPLRKEFLISCGLVIGVYSLLGHKEVRFIMPLLPIFHAFTASSLRSFLSSTKVLSKFGLLLILVLNASIALYATRVHQAGVMSLTKYIRTHPEIESLTLLMPCHSTPWQSHIHRPLANLRFLTCEPPLHLPVSEHSTYRDEADQFYDNPSLFLVHDFEKYGIADYYATFEASQAVLEEFWRSKGYMFHVHKRWFNSHFHDDARRKGDVLLYRLVPSGGNDLNIAGARQGYQAFS